MMMNEWNSNDIRRQLCKYVCKYRMIACVIYRAFTAPIAVTWSFSVSITDVLEDVLTFPSQLFSYFRNVTSQDCSNHLDVEPIGWNCVDLCRAACQRQPQCVQTYGLFLLTVWRAFGKEVFSFGAGCRLNMLYL